MQTTKITIQGVVPLGTISGTATVDAALGNYFTSTLGAATAITISNLKPGQPVYIQITQGASYAVTWAGQATGASGVTPGGTTVYQFVGNSAVEGSGSATLVSSASSAAASGDEVVLYSNGSDDTANIAAVVQAGLFAVLAPSGGTFFVDGTTMPVLTAANSGGIIGSGEGVEIRPTTAWVPAIGLVDDATNCFVRVEGADTTSGYTGSIAATVQVRGGYVLTGIGSTAGIAAGDVLEVKASPTGGSSLPVQRCMVKVATVASGTVITTHNMLRLMYGDSYNTLPALLTEIEPINRFQLKNLRFTTLGRNIAGIANFVRCFPASAGSLSPTVLPVPGILVENVSGAGFTRAMFSESCCDGIVYRNNFSAGSNNGCWMGSTSHAARHSGWRSTPTGPAFNAVGFTNPALYSSAGGSDLFIVGNQIDCMAGFDHVVGGFGNFFDDNVMIGAQSDIRLTRDRVPVAYMGSMHDGSLAATTNTDISVGYSFGTMSSKESYTNATTTPVSFTTGIWAFVIVDTHGLTFNTLHIENDGNGGNTLNGVNYSPCGGAYFFDCFYGGTGSIISARNVSGASMCVRQGGWAGILTTLVHNKRAGKSTGTTVNTTILFATSGSRTLPRIGTILLPDGGNIADYDATFVAAPDYQMQIGEYLNIGASTWFKNIRVSLNAGPVTYTEGHVAALDATSANATRRILEAGANANSPVIVVQNTNSTIALIATGGGTALTAGAVAVNDLLATEGGATHRAITNNAATLRQVLGQALLAKGAGNANIDVQN